MIRIKNFKKDQLQVQDDYFEKFIQNNPEKIEKAGIKHVNLKKKSEDLKDKLEKSKNELDIRHSEELKSTNLSDVDFTHLHNHSQFSMLQSTIKIKELVEKAHECNMKAVALTDHGNMMGPLGLLTPLKRKTDKSSKIVIILKKI